MSTATLRKLPIGEGATANHLLYRASAPSRQERPITVRRDTDDILIHRIVTGDKVAMRALFVRHRSRVYRLVCRLVGDDGMAEDIVNEVFIDIWRKAHQFKGHSQVLTWVLSIARFRALSCLRQRQFEALDELDATAIIDDDDDPEAIVQKKDRNAILRECTNHLSPRHREIIDLFYYHDKSVDEVSHIVGVPKSTVKTRIFYARKRMFELLQQAGIDQTCQ